MLLLSPSMDCVPNGVIVVVVLVSISEYVLVSAGVSVLWIVGESFVLEGIVVGKSVDGSTGTVVKVFRRIPSVDSVGLLGIVGTEDISEYCGTV